MILSTLFLGGRAQAAYYIDDFEGVDGGTFGSAWQHLNQQGFLASTTRYISPTHSFASASTYSEDSIALAIPSNSVGTLRAKVYCDNTNMTIPAPFNPICFDIGLTQGLSTMYDGSFEGVRFHTNATTTIGYLITQGGGYQIFPADSNSREMPNNYNLNDWNDFRADWRNNLGITEFRFYINNTYDTGWISTATSTQINAVFLASYADNSNGTPYGFIDDIQVWTDADAPLPPSSTSFISSFTYATSTATARVQGFWEATTTPNIQQKLSFWQYSNALGKESYVQLTATTTGDFDFTFDFKDPFAFTTGATTTAPIYDSFTLNASLDQYDYTNYVFGQLPPENFITNLDTAQININASTTYNASDFISNPRALALYPEYECGITSLTGCLKNAIIWAFYPTQEALDNWASLQTTMQNKAPVGYFYMTKNSISGVSATSTKAFNIIIPSSLKTYIFNPFDIGVAGILWFFFIFNFYKRLKSITI